jgi:lipoyl(octanoyl) transferase
MLGRADYLPTSRPCRSSRLARTPATPDALWMCEHPPVFTQGLAGKADHVLNPGTIPGRATTRGGQVTYHGPGQVVAYPLVDLKRAGYYVKEYVYRIEEAVIRTLAHYGVTGHRVAGARASMCGWTTRFSHLAADRTGPSRATRSRAWARSPPWASRSRATAPGMAWR